MPEIGEHDVVRRQVLRREVERIRLNDFQRIRARKVRQEQRAEQRNDVRVTLDDGHAAYIRLQKAVEGVVAQP